MSAMCTRAVVAALVVLVAPGIVAAPVPPGPYLIGNVTAVYDMLERVLPGSSTHFSLSLVPSCGMPSPCFSVSDGPGGVVSVVGTSASELSAGVGVYLREVRA
jgi:hypothetical protein